ncbi:helix-turn-helix domain-containing protein [Parasediminibacterium sp. JCM 36343]|uniref:helix-turn-helix domain-containing protein n=1 Tax=Parasediminibacterium sp. JCM 36343 TaxID=3374279 RepID=UPI00397D82A8
MLIGKNIKKVREAKGLSQKEVALTCKMDTGHYSRIENDKSDPALSSLAKIANALGVGVVDLFTADEVFRDINSMDKTMVEKVALLEQLDKKEKAAFFVILDGLLAKKKLKDNLASVLHGA